MFRAYKCRAKLATGIEKEQNMSEHKYKQGDVVRMYGVTYHILEVHENGYSYAKKAEADDNNWQTGWSGVKALRPEPLTAEFECEWAQTKDAFKLNYPADLASENENVLDQFFGKRTRVTIEEIV